MIKFMISILLSMFPIHAVFAAELIVSKSIESTCFRNNIVGAKHPSQCTGQQINEVYIASCPAGGYTQVDTWVVRYLDQDGKIRDRRYQESAYVELSHFFGKSTESMVAAQWEAIRQYEIWARDPKRNIKICR